MANYTDIAIGDLGTQVFHFNTAENTFEYALPVTAGAEFGGDTESFDAPETDLDYVPKVGGRTTLNDVSYTINYTSEKYARIRQITDNIKANVYMEVFQDGSAAIFKGTAGIPTITAGDVRQLTMTIMPDYLLVVQNIKDLSEDEQEDLTALATDLAEIWDVDSLALYEGTAIKIDASTIPAQRAHYNVLRTETQSA